jgi:hypothetical protein
MSRGISVQQTIILERLRLANSNGHALEAADLVDVFFSDEDRRTGFISPERRKELRARVKRALKALHARGIVTLYYSEHPHGPAYGPKRMYAELPS